jgi:hypothetical protein
MSKQLYIDKDNTTLGPYSEQEVIAYIKSGQLSPFDSACYVGDVKWSKLDQLVTLPVKASQQQNPIQKTPPVAPKLPPPPRYSPKNEASNTESNSPQIVLVESNSNSGCIVSLGLALAIILFLFFVADPIYNEYFDPDVKLIKTGKKEQIEQWSKHWQEYLRDTEMCFYCEGELALVCDKEKNEYPSMCVHCGYKPGAEDISYYKSKRGSVPTRLSPQQEEELQKALNKAVMEGKFSPK